MATTSGQGNPMLAVFTQRKMAALLLLGFSSGMPLYLTSRTVSQCWSIAELGR